MDLNKADYWTIIRFGNLNKFKEKLDSENEKIEKVVDFIDQQGISLLEKALIGRKFDIANYLLDNKAKVNIISNESCNELHYLAANINYPGGIELAYRLVDLGVDLNLKDNKYGNSAILSLCQEVLKERTDDGNKLIVECLKRRPNINDSNKYGYSLKQLIGERGTIEMKNTLEMIC